MSRNLTLPELKQAALEVLLEIDRVCKELNIRYFLAYGTLLGAVRHKGFIPWDDDIDLWLFRDEMNILIENFNKLCKPEFKLFNYSDNKFPYGFPKVINLKTTAEEKGLKKLPDLGVWVDLFYLDYVPENDIEEMDLLRKFELRRWMSMYHMSTPWQKIKLINVGIFNNKVSLSDRHKTPAEVMKELNSHLMSHSPAPLVRTAFSLPDIPKKFDIDIFKTTVLLPFEGHMLPAPSAYDILLKQLYGDYMKLPPKSKQVLAKHFRRVESK